MPDIVVHETAHEHLNAWCGVADNPFYGPTTLHPNPTGYVAASWVLSGFPAARATFISGNCAVGLATRTAPVILEVEVEQGDRKSARTFLISNGRENRYGIALLNDGSPYKLTFRASLESQDDFAGSAFQIGPLECTTPIYDSMRPTIYRMGIGDGPALISCNQGGLMNRVIPLMSALQIANETQGTAYAWWGRNEHCAAELPDIFEVGDIVDPSRFADSYDAYFAYEENAAPLQLYSGRRNKLIHSITPIRTTPSIANDVASAAATFAKMPLAKPINEKLARYSDLDLSKTIGFHIRRPYPSGAFNEQERSKFNLGIDVFLDLIERLREALPEFQRVLLCTNGVEAESAVKNHFGDYIIVNEKESVDNTNNPIAVQDAIVDLMLMSRCPILFSQETTAFGHFAHAIGDNKLFAVIKSTSADAFEFWQFTRGVHTASISTPRNDIRMLANSIRDGDEAR